MFTTTHEYRNEEIQPLYYYIRIMKNATKTRYRLSKNVSYIRIKKSSDLEAALDE